MIRSVPLTALSLTLGFFFILVGLLKVTPKINPEMYNDMKNEFGRFNKVFPLFKYTGWKPYARTYRLTVGITEAVCGFILVMIPGRLKEVATVVLMAMMTGGFFTHYSLNDKFERMAPALVFTMLLLCRLIIAYQVERRERLNFEKFVQEAQDYAAAEEEEEKKKLKEQKSEQTQATTADNQKNNAKNSKKSSKKNK